MVDRALSCVSAPVRLVGMLVCVLCVCLTQSPLYLMLMAAIALVLVAVRPVRGLGATFMPALAAAGFAVVLALPALLLGASATGAMLKIALKTFINVSLVLGVSRTLTWSQHVRRRLRCCTCPTRLSLRLIWHSSISRCWDARRTICANRSCCAVSVPRRGFFAHRLAGGYHGHDLYQGDGMQPRDGRGHAVPRLCRCVSGSRARRVWLARCGLCGRRGAAGSVVRRAVGTAGFGWGCK